MVIDGDRLRFAVALYFSILFYALACYAYLDDFRGITLLPPFFASCAGSTGNPVFIRKKRQFILFVFVLNTACIWTIVSLPGTLAITACVIGLKCKDVITSSVQTFISLRKCASSFFARDDPRGESRFVAPPLRVVCVIPAYSEPTEEVMQTMDSLCRQTQQYRDDTQVLLVIVKDGKPISLPALEDAAEAQITLPYTSWKKLDSSIAVSGGSYRDTPFLIVEKNKNGGKKDSLILGHDLFLEVPRNDIPPATFSSREKLRAFVGSAFDIQSFNFNFSTDADSIIIPGSVESMWANLTRRDADAIAGIVEVLGGYDFWTCFQTFSYLYGQFMRRGTEDLVGRVTCLPGAISGFRIRPPEDPKSTIAAVAISRYAELPQEGDLYGCSSQLLGTDRRLTNSFLHQSKSVKTIYDTEAACLTGPPVQLKKYLSQRRRWGSNCFWNGGVHCIKKESHPLTRFFSFLDFSRLLLSYFRTFNSVLFIYLVSKKGVEPVQVAAVCSVIFYPALYFFASSLFRPRLRRLYLKLVIGWLYNRLCSGLIGVAVVSNLFGRIGSLKWGGNQTN